ncbi:MAG: hypothetical protein FWG27_07695 [Treponema sp.]|nr:hypothetical protein [Treponema sp.]
MKKTAFVFVLALMALTVFAQREKPETVTVTGNLGLTNGRITVKSGDDVYYVMGIQRLIGFVDAVKEGAQVSLEGHIRNIPRGDAKVLLASKLTVAGKSYDLGPANRTAANAPRQGSPENKPRNFTGRGRGTPCCGAPYGNRGTPWRVRVR